MGLGLPEVGLIIGGASLITNLLGQSNQATESRNANLTNQEIAEKNNETAKQIAADNNQLQVDQQQANRDLSKEMQQLEFKQQEKMWELQTKYNSPVEQVSRLRAAGLNPQLYMSGGSGVMTQSMPSVPSAPLATGSGINPSMPNLQNAQVQPVPGMFANFATSLKELSDAYKSFHSAQLDAKEKERLAKLIPLEAKRTFEEGKGLELNNMFESLFGPAMHNSKIQQNVASAQLSYAQAFLAKQNGDSEKYKRGLYSAQAAMNRAISKVNGEQAELLRKANDTFYEKFDHEIGLIDSQKYSNYASGHNQQAQADTTNGVREFVIDMSRYNSQMSLADLKERAATLESNIERVLNENETIIETDRIKLQQMQVQLRNAKASASTYWFDYSFNKVKQIAETISSFIPLAPERRTDDYHYGTTQYDENYKVIGHTENTYTRHSRSTKGR